MPKGLTCSNMQQSRSIHELAVPMGSGGSTQILYSSKVVKSQEIYYTTTLQVKAFI